MPLEITTLGIKEQSVRICTSTDASTSPGIRIWKVKAPYTFVGHGGYGRMNTSTLGRGLCTDSVATVAAVVMHCHTTQRTILSHSGNYLYMPTYIPMVDWVTGGPEVSTFSSTPSLFEARRFYAGLDRPGLTPTTLDIVVLRGSGYADPLEAKKFDHDSWMRALRKYFEIFSSRRRITLDIFDSPSIVKYSSFLVDKGSGKITIVEPLDLPKQPLEVPRAIGLEQASATQFSDAQLMQAMFVRNLDMISHQKTPPPIDMQFDGKRHCLPPPLTDEARQLLRSVRQNEPLSSQRAIIVSFGRSNDWLTEPHDEGDNTQRNLLMNIAKMKVCELCEKEGSAVCQACKGAWYCKLHRLVVNVRY